MSADPWIIRPGQKCDNCGACCMHLAIPPLDAAIYEWNDESDPDWSAMPLWLRITVLAAYDRGRLELGASGALPCLFLDQKTKRCRHYEERPSICRNFEPGNWCCIEDRQLLGIE